MSYYDERSQVRPINNEKIQELHARLKQYRADGFGQKHKPWNKEICIVLGKIYFEAWNCMPISRRMEFMYGLPNNKVIKRIFGSFEEFYEAIRLELMAFENPQPDQGMVDAAQI